MAVSDAQLADFRKFLEDVAALRPASSSLADQARQFFADARPLLAAELEATLPALRRRVQPLAEWLVPAHEDLLAVAGLTFVEDAYTELVAWLLTPETHPPTAVPRQQALLDLLGAGLRTDTAVVPQTQVLTDDGIPDLVLR